MTQASVEASLRDAAAPFVPPAGEHPVALRWGSVFEALTGDEGAYVEAIELIYEGYLMHYRTGRLAVVDANDRETALLAGDVFYARGLDIVAARGDMASVALLTRLMAACSCLRTQGAPFSADDALWAYTMAALAAVRHGISADRAAAFFDELDAELGRGAPTDLPGRAAAAAAALGLSDTAPLAAAFAAGAPHVEPIASPPS